MIKTRSSPGIEEKLTALSRESRYDLACACSVNDYEHRKRSEDGKWIYPVTLEDGRKTFLLKTLISSVCTNDCLYCPLRAGQDFQRHTLNPQELAALFSDYRKKGLVSGIFLSSGVNGSPDRAMQKIIDTAAIIRRTGFRGYMHLKILPGAADAAIEEAVSLSSAVSVNLETPGETAFRKLSLKKDYIDDIIRPLKLISRLTEKGSRFSRVKQTTQFVVGAADEKDMDIVKYSWRLYKKLGLSRVYFSSYQRGAGDLNLPGEQSPFSNSDMLLREHRLYQTDWLMRKYGFSADEIPFSAEGNLYLDTDPKEAWAKANPQFFPVDINRADKMTLLRIPGFGHKTVSRIIEERKTGRKFRRTEDIGKKGRLLEKASAYIKF